MISIRILQVKLERALTISPYLFHRFSLQPTTQLIPVVVLVKDHTSAAHATHVVVNADRVALRAVPRRVIVGIAGLRVGALCSCAVDVHPGSVHVPHRLAERHIGGGITETMVVGVRGG